VTFFGIFLTPVFFYLVRWLSGQSRRVKEPVQEILPVSGGKPSAA
jgi:hypothetical protein